MSCKNPIISRITQILSNFTRFQPNTSSRVAFITQIVYFQLSKHVNNFRRYLYFRFYTFGGAPSNLGEIYDKKLVPRIEKSFYCIFNVI